MKIEKSHNVTRGPAGIIRKFKANRVTVFKVGSHDPQSHQKNLPIFNFPTLSPAKYFYKMAPTAGPSCSEAGMDLSKQEF